MAEPRDMPLMTPIRPSAINLSLKFQHFSTSAYYVAFVKKYLNRDDAVRVRVQAKRST